MQHEFAFFIHHLSSLATTTPLGETITIIDQDLMHRIIHVIRMEPGHQCIFFDRDTYIQVSLEAYHGKKTGRFTLLSRHTTTSLKPAITALLPILKRDTFELTCYNLAELGVTTIQPLITKKIQRSWGGEKEMERIKKIIIAAAEQSKHFTFPLVEKPLSIETIPVSGFDALLYADPQGDNLWQIMSTLRTKKPTNIAFMIGPEGDLTQEEKQYIADKGFAFCALTPTILRAYQAATLMAGCIRSLV